MGTIQEKTPPKRFEVAHFQTYLPACGRVGRNAAGEGKIGPSPLALLATLPEESKLIFANER